MGARIRRNTWSWTGDCKSLVTSSQTDKKQKAGTWILTGSLVRSGFSSIISMATSKMCGLVISASRTTISVLPVAGKRSRQPFYAIPRARLLPQIPKSNTQERKDDSEEVDEPS